MRYVNGVRAPYACVRGRADAQSRGGFERITDHIEIGDGLVEDVGKVGDDATVSQSGIRVEVFDQHFGDIFGQHVPFPVHIVTLVIVVAGKRG